MKESVLKRATYLLWVFFFIFSFFYRISEIKADTSKLSFEECENLVKKIAETQDKLRKFVEEKNFNVTYRDLSADEKNFFKETLKTYLTDKELFNKACYKYYIFPAKKVDELDHFVFFLGGYACFSGTLFSKDYKLNIFSWNFPAFFFDLKVRDGLDVRYLAFDKLLGDPCNKAFKEFSKKYLSGYETKALFCKINENSIICPRFHLEKSFDFTYEKLPITERKISYKDPSTGEEIERTYKQPKNIVYFADEDLEITHKEGISVLGFLFTGKLRYSYDQKLFKLDENLKLYPYQVNRILFGLFYSEEPFNWLRRELGLRGLMKIN